MKIQSVTVEIHEKRNNPNAYGHYDSRVAYTADLDDGEEAKAVVEQLQFVARQQVAIECDRWEAEVKLQEKRSNARTNLDWIIDRVLGSGLDDRDARQFEKNLEPLLEEEQTEFRGKLEKAQAGYWSSVRDTLDNLIGRVERNTAHSSDIDRFNMLVECLPNAEQDEYRQRMEAALDRAESVGASEEIPY